MRAKRRDYFAILFLIFIILLLFFNPLFFERMFFFRDIFQNHFPVKKISTEIMKNGEFPLWNPYQSFGQPLLANLNYASFYPLCLFFLFLPHAFAFNFSIILNFFLAGFFFYLLARDFKLKVGSSLLGSLIFLLSGYILSLGNLYNALATTAWLPFTFLLFRRGLRQRSWLNLMGASLSLTIQFFGGEPVTLALTLLLLFIYSFFHASETKSSRPEYGKNLLYLGSISLIALMLSMIQLLPFLELLIHSQRWQGLPYREVTKWSFNPLRLLELFVPQMLGNPTTLYFKEFSGQSFFDKSYPFIISVYVGILPLLLVVAALIIRWNRETKFWSFLLVSSLLLSFGHYLPFHRFIYNLIPVLKIFRYPTKFFVLVTLSIAMLAAFGADSLLCLEENERKISSLRKKTRYLFYLVILFILLFIALYVWMIISPATFKEALGRTYLAGQHSEGWLQRAYQVFKDKYVRSLAFALISSLILLVLFSYRLRVKFKILLIFCCILLDVIPMNFEINPTVSKDFYNQPPAVSQFLKQDESYFRIYRAQRPKNVLLSPLDASIQWTHYWDKEVLTPASAVIYKISYGFDINADKLNSASYINFVKYANDQPTPLKLKLMGLGNIKYILSFKYIKDPNLFAVREFINGSNVTLKIYQNLLCMPRVYLVDRGVPAKDEKKALRAMLEPAFVPKNMIILPEGAEVLESSPEDVRPLGNCRIASYEANRVVVDAEIRKRCYLILADSFHPGWEVKINGRKGDILRANLLFRAVILPKGKHRIVFQYRPKLFYIGSLISLAGILSIIVISFLIIWRRRHIKRADKDR
jgi:hypothetical protein